MKRIAGILFLLLLTGCSIAGTAGTADSGSVTGVTLVYSGNLNGELEPCGCSEEGDLGGVKRRGNMLKTLRQQEPGLVLLSSGGLISHEAAQDRLKGKYILSGLQTMAYDAIGVQWQDLAFGTGLLTGADLPWVASNWRDHDVFASQRGIKRGDLTLRVFSWLDPVADPARAMQAGNSQVDERMDALAAALRKAKQAAELTVVMCSLPLEKAQASLPMPYIDVLVIESRHEVYAEPRKLEHTLVLQPGSRGMRLGKVHLTLDSSANITAFQHKVLELPTSTGDDPALLTWYENYNKDVKAAYLKKVELRKALRAGKSPYAGYEACEECHAAAFSVWEESEHAKAFEDLEKVNKSFDPECLQCHTVGFDQDGGFVDMKLSFHLAAVQCENCHGASQAHVESGGATATANKGWNKEQICRQCHVGSHSPLFSVDKYWPKIAHGK